MALPSPPRFVPGPAARAEAAVALAHLRLPDGFAFTGSTALWLYGHGPVPVRVEAGVPYAVEPVDLPGVRVRRVAPSTLRRPVSRSGHPLVGFEVAVVQAAAGLAAEDVHRLVDAVLLDRRTTSTRLLASCRRGLRGSAGVRQALGARSQDGADARQRLLVRALRAAGVHLRTEVRLESAAGAVAYLDGLHEPSRRALEVDGASTHGTAEQQLVDRRRDRWVLHEHGIETVRVAVREVDAGLDALVAELVPMFPGR